MKCIKWRNVTYSYMGFISFYFVIVFYSSNAHACPNTLQLLEPCRILGLWEPSNLLPQQLHMYFPNYSVPNILVLKTWTPFRVTFNLEFFSGYIRPKKCGMVFCFQNCSYLRWAKFFPGIEKKLFKAEGQEFLDH